MSLQLHNNNYDDRNNFTWVAWVKNNCKWATHVKKPDNFRDGDTGIMYMYMHSDGRNQLC